MVIKCWVWIALWAVSFYEDCGFKMESECLMKVKIAQKCQRKKMSVMPETPDPNLTPLSIKPIFRLVLV